jgi:hypothetical protein
MNIRQLKNIMKEVNAPNEIEMFAFDLMHPYYWIFEAKNVRVKTLYSKLEDYRRPSARFDVFINGLLQRDVDYVFEMVDNNFYIKFKRANFPALDRFGNEYQIEETDEIKINGDVEYIS